MYSNNIVNFQESMTILNACTEKDWNLIECTTYVTDSISNCDNRYANNDSQAEIYSNNF